MARSSRSHTAAKIAQNAARRRARRGRVYRDMHSWAKKNAGTLVVRQATPEELHHS